MYEVTDALMSFHPSRSRQKSRGFVSSVADDSCQRNVIDFTNPEFSTSQIYLFSLQWTPDERISKPCRDLWKWKDATLGDGRDFFVPKPKTIKALQSHLQTHCRLRQISVLSNCARFEIICVCDKNPIQDICRVLFAQIQSNKPNAVMNVLTQSMDIPEWVLRSESLRVPEFSTSESRELARHWEVKVGAENILQHLCLVAAGMASRPRRPERHTIFRPFSSRDAHIMLQLKRTKEIAEGNQIHQLLEYTLRAGKAARNTNIVPALNLLRDYGTGDSKYSSEPPRDLLTRVSEAVIEQAINPLVQEFVQVAGISDETGMAIALLRTNVEALARTTAERAWLKKRLHKPTIDIRKGNVGLQDIQRELDLIEVEFKDYKSRES